MPQISEQTPVIAIQAVAWEVRSLRRTVAGAAAREDERRMSEAGLHPAEHFLEHACDAEVGTAVDLPPCHPPAGG